MWPGHIGDVMKVFLSHSTKDKQFVQAFAAELKAEKIEPWLCEVDVEFGGNFVGQIEEGLRDADLTVLFWSPEAARSDWTRLEWTSVTAREISESRTRLGIVLLRDCAVPELLRLKHRIDARTDPEKARHETVAWIKRLRDMRRLAETTALGVFLPPPPHDFVGRAEAVEILYAALVEKQDKALLHGEPGCGKSTLALKFAWQTQGAFDAVVFQLCGQRPVAEIAAELAAKLKLGLETRPPEEQIAAAKAWLAGRRALLVLDDIWENDVIALALGPPVSLLCTARWRALSQTPRRSGAEKTWGPVDGGGHAMIGWRMEEEAKIRFTITVNWQREDGSITTAQLRIFIRGMKGLLGRGSKTAYLTGTCPSMPGTLGLKS